MKLVWPNDQYIYEIVVMDDSSFNFTYVTTYAKV